MHTRAAWSGKYEIVDLHYDPKLTDTQSLLAQAKRIRRLQKAWVCDEAQLGLAKELLGDRAELKLPETRDGKASDRRFYLRRSLVWYLPLLDVQAVRINARIAAKQPFATLLTPAQRSLLKRLQALPEDRRKELVGLQPARGPEAFAGYLEQLEAALR